MCDKCLTCVDNSMELLYVGGSGTFASTLSFNSIKMVYGYEEHSTLGSRYVYYVMLCCVSYACVPLSHAWIYCLQIVRAPVFIVFVSCVLYSAGKFGYRRTTAIFICFVYKQ